MTSPDTPLGSPAGGDPTFDTLKTVLVRDYRVAPESVTLDTSLGDMGIDSLATVELLWFAEDEFKIQLPTDHVDLRTMGDVVRHIDATVAAKALLGAEAAKADTGLPA
ncbi:MAG: phosphopantetheine-binding protein [Pseudomonadota bacterium]